MKYNNNPNAYINAQALEVAIVKTTTYGDALNALRKEPSIDLVRCKECVYSYEIDTDFGTLWFCKKYQYHFNADDFCSYGEREGE